MRDVTRYAGSMNGVLGVGRNETVAKRVKIVNWVHLQLRTSSLTPNRILCHDVYTKKNYIESGRETTYCELATLILLLFLTINLISEYKKIKKKQHRFRLRYESNVNILQLTYSLHGAQSFLRS
jgi:hypothetical protein